MAIKINEPEEVVVKYSEVAPLVSKHINFEDIPVKAVPVSKPLANITKTKVKDIVASELGAWKLSVKHNLSKGQVIKIQKEYQVAIRHKSYGGVE
jgi:hypothetical protein